MGKRTKPKSGERKSVMPREALDAIANGSLPKGYRGPFSLKTGLPIRIAGTNTPPKHEEG